MHPSPAREADIDRVGRVAAAERPSNRLHDTAPDGEKIRQLQSLVDGSPQAREFAERSAAISGSPPLSLLGQPVSRVSVEGPVQRTVLESSESEFPVEAAPENPAILQRQEAEPRRPAPHQIDRRHGPVQRGVAGESLLHVADSLVPLYTMCTSFRDMFKNERVQRDYYPGWARKLLVAKNFSQGLAAAASAASIICGILAIFTVGASATVLPFLAAIAAGLHGMTALLRLIDIGVLTSCIKRAGEGNDANRLKALRKAEWGKLANNVIRGVTAGLGAGGVLGALGPASNIVGADARLAGKNLVLATGAGKEPERAPVRSDSQPSRSASDASNYGSFGTTERRGSVAHVEERAPSEDVRSSVESGSGSVSSRSPEPEVQSERQPSGPISFEEFGARLDRLSADLEGLRARLEQLQQDLDALAVRLQKMKQDLDQLSGRLTALERPASGLEHAEGPSSSALSSGLSDGNVERAESATLRAESEIGVSDGDERVSSEGGSKSAMQQKPGIFARLKASWLGRKVKKLIAAARKKILGVLGPLVGAKEPATEAGEEVSAVQSGMAEGASVRGASMKEIDSARASLKSLKGKLSSAKSKGDGKG